MRRIATANRQVCVGGTGSWRAVDVHLQDHREPEAGQGENPQEGRCRLLRRWRRGDYARGACRNELEAKSGVR